MPARKPTAPPLGSWGKGRRGCGHGQKRFLDEQHEMASHMFGEDFVEMHEEALRKGRTKVPLSELMKKRK